MPATKKTAALSKEVISIQKKLAPALEEAKKLVIKNDKDLATATTLLSNVNKYLDAAKEQKEKVLRPLLDATKALRDQYKPLETAGEGIVTMVRRKMTEYQTTKKREADEKAEKLAARVGKGPGKLTAETAMAKMGEIDQPVESVSTGAGQVKFKTVEKFEVMDVAMLSAVEKGAYILPNEVKIREAMKAGLKLPGVRYYTEEVPVNYR